MQTSTIRYKLHQYIDESDEKLLQLMYTLAREYKGDAEGDVSDEISNEDLLRYEERQAKRLNGTSKTHRWEEAKAIITGRKIP
jgi:hypothetical protein